MAAATGGNGAPPTHDANLGTATTPPDGDQATADARACAVAALKKWGYNDAAAPLVGYSEVCALRARGVEVVVVDVRSAAETAVSRIEGAVLKADFEARGGCAAYPEDTVIAPSCTVGFRSGVYCRELLAASPPPKQAIRNNEGILLHTFDGGRVVTPAGASTTRVHTYNAGFAHLPSTHTAVCSGGPGTWESVRLGCRACWQTLCRKGS